MRGRILSFIVLLCLTLTSAPQGESGQGPSRGGESAVETVVVAAVGDIMLGSSWPDASGLPPDDGVSLLREVAPILSAADIAFGNLEGSLLDGGVPSKCPPQAKNCYVFRTPTRYGKYLQEAGFDVLSLANNHALDFGVAGRQSTKQVLDRLGIAYTGEVGDIARLNVRGRDVAVIAFSTYDHSYNLNRLEEAQAVVADLAMHSDIVIVSFHGGAEGPNHQHVPRGREWFLGEDRGDLRRFAHAMVDAGADLLLGHGPHVVRGMEVYRKRLIAYSLGNLATYRKFNLDGPRGLSLILEVELGPDGALTGGRVHPIRQVKPGGPRLDPEGAVLPILRRLSVEDFGPNAVVIDAEGRLRPP